MEFCTSRGGTLVDESNPALQGFLSWELWRRHKVPTYYDFSTYGFFRTFFSFLCGFMVKFRFSPTCLFAFIYLDSLLV